ncbi:hypothetical protein SAMN05444392_101362 [Seinonella peptonophila]|uniref:Uncharacterized protein n=1 Tax=Seinonella peptonophila TaxID=112248 RepID=A0A1M4T8P1_9BACL|nr:hypothetical protein [Seinonella peptonophila]SHE40831.1 hypothetical protein SAMN05444392_101362 [Seinonella peptonophila]
MIQPSNNLTRLFDISSLDELENGALFSQSALNRPDRFKSEEISQGIDYLKRKIGLLQTLKDSNMDHEEVKNFLETYQMILENLGSRPSTKPIGDFLETRRDSKFPHSSADYYTWAQELQEVYKETLSTLFDHQDINRYKTTGQIPRLKFNTLDPFQNNALNELVRDLFMHQGFQNYALSQEIKEHQGKVNIDGNEIVLPDHSYEYHFIGKFFKGYYTDTIPNGGKKNGHFEKMPLDDIDDCLDYFEQKVLPSLPYTNHDLISRSLGAVLKSIETEVNHVFGYGHIYHAGPTKNQAQDLRPRQIRIKTIEKAFQEAWAENTHPELDELLGSFTEQFADLNAEMTRSIRRASNRDFAITPIIQPKGLSQEGQEKSEM